MAGLLLVSRSGASFADTLMRSWPEWRNGRRDGLKIRCPEGRVGSSPTSGTQVIHTLAVWVNDFFTGDCRRRRLVSRNCRRNFTW